MSYTLPYGSDWVAGQDAEVTQFVANWAYIQTALNTLDTQSSHSEGLTNPGYVNFENLQIRFGEVTDAATITFNQPFTTACLMIMTHLSNTSSGNYDNRYNCYSSKNKNGFTPTLVGSGSTRVYIAVGY